MEGQLSCRRRTAGGTVAFDFPEGYEVAQALIEQGVLVDYRPRAGVRVSPHFYNTEEDVDRFFEVAEEILETKAYLRHRGTRTTVT
jgi:kynureninase